MYKIRKMVDQDDLRWWTIADENGHCIGIKATWEEAMRTVQFLIHAQEMLNIIKRQRSWY